MCHKLFKKTKQLKYTLARIEVEMRFLNSAAIDSSAKNLTEILIRSGRAKIIKYSHKYSNGMWCNYSYPHIIYILYLHILLSYVTNEQNWMGNSVPRKQSNAHMISIWHLIYRKWNFSSYVLNQKTSSLSTSSIQQCKKKRNLCKKNAFLSHACAKIEVNLTHTRWKLEI